MRSNGGQVRHIGPWGGRRGSKGGDDFALDQFAKTGTDRADILQHELGNPALAPRQAKALAVDTAELAQFEFARRQHHLFDERVSKLAVDNLPPATFAINAGRRQILGQVQEIAADLAPVDAAGCDQAVDIHAVPVVPGTIHNNATYVVPVPVVDADHVEDFVVELALGLPILRCVASSGDDYRLFLVAVGSGRVLLRRVFRVIVLDGCRVVDCRRGHALALVRMIGHDVDGPVLGMAQRRMWVSRFVILFQITPSILIGQWGCHELTQLPVCR